MLITAELCRESGTEHSLIKITRSDLLFSAHFWQSQFLTLAFSLLLGRMWVFTHTRQKACAQELRVTMGSISRAAVPRKRITLISLLGTRKSTEGQIERLWVQ